MNEDLDNLLKYLQKAGLNTINTNSPAWKLLHKVKGRNLLTRQKIDNSIGFRPKKVDISIGYENGQKLTVGQLVRHRTVPQLGLGLVVAESKVHKGFWMIQWCDPRYYDVGNLGIDQDYLEIV